MLLIGQSTYGWDWPGKEVPKLYPEWQHRPILSFRDFITDKVSVDWLMRGYELFDFGARQPRTRNGAFWRFFRSVLTSLRLPGAAGMWSNLFRVDVGGIPAHLSDCAHAVRTYQKNLLPAEIDLLRPDVIVFATGWSLDEVIREQLGEFHAHAIGRMDPKILSRMSFSDRALLVFRTYHPAYLNRIEKLKVVLGMIAREVQKHR